MRSFDRIIIGAGPGGYVAAIRAAQLGAKVALVEKGATLGGTCLNVGCIPSKALLESSELVHLARTRFAGHGIQLGGFEVDLPTMQARKARVVSELTDGIAQLMKKNKVSVLRGVGRLLGEGRVELSPSEGEAEVITAPAIILATGSAPVEIPALPFDGEYIVSSTEALSFDRIPEHLVVIGAGAIGLELGSVWMRLGTRVTVVEMMPGVVPTADSRVARLLERALKKQGMSILTRAKVTGATVADGRVTVSVEDKKGKTQEIEADKLLVAVGRRPYRDGLGLEEAGVAVGEDGRVRVDERFATSAEGVYAIGDLIAGPMLAHRAEEEGVALAELLAGLPGAINHDLIPSVVYTEPEMAAVGLSEDEAKATERAVRTGSFYFKANGRAKSMESEEGMVKIIADSETDRILGVHMVGPRVSELIGEAVVAMEFQASAEDLARTIHAHPTLSEAVKEAALAVDGRAIHG